MAGLGSSKAASDDCRDSEYSASDEISEGVSKTSFSV